MRETYAVEREPAASRFELTRARASARARARALTCSLLEAPDHARARADGSPSCSGSWLTYAVVEGGRKSALLNAHVHIEASASYANRSMPAFPRVTRHFVGVSIGAPGL